MAGQGKLHIGAPWAEQVEVWNQCLLRRKQGACKGVQDEIAAPKVLQSDGEVQMT